MQNKNYCMWPEDHLNKASHKDKSLKCWESKITKQNKNKIIIIILEALPRRSNVIRLKKRINPRTSHERGILATQDGENREIFFRNTFKLKT